MRGRTGLLLLLSAGTATAQYYYDYSYPLANAAAPTWQFNGWAFVASYGAYFPYGSSSGGSLIYQPAVSGSNPNDYEISANYEVNEAGGTYISFVRATNNAWPGNGSYVSVEMVVPSTWCGCGATVPAQLNINQTINGVTTQLGSTAVTYPTHGFLRTVVFGTNLWVYTAPQLETGLSSSVGNSVPVWQGSISLTTGQPGVGGYNVPSENSIGLVAIGHHDVVAPYAVNWVSP